MKLVSLLSQEESPAGRVVARKSFVHSLQEELLKNVLFKHLNHVELDSSVEVRVRAARLLLSVVRNSRTYAGTHVIDLLHKVSAADVVSVLCPECSWCQLHVDRRFSLNLEFVSCFWSS